ncbi:hypothetical protein GCM10009737_07940 [Nocardioides lentus]|uniref:Four helix bundle protein n=1 Tax=Nocardioides lentus TaxID=338077 RepID=A0ABP5AHB3_9ACTN
MTGPHRMHAVIVAAAVNRDLVDYIGTLSHHEALHAATHLMRGTALVSNDGRVSDERFRSEARLTSVATRLLLERAVATDRTAGADLASDCRAACDLAVALQGMWKRINDAVAGAGDGQ